nr:hypothetical protein [Acidobacteriota bacterium]
SEKNGKLSADAENLRAVDDALAQSILRFRSEYKVLSTYVRPMISRHFDSGMRMWKEPFLAEDGRIHANYRQVGARTGRMSCSDPNMQNQPRDDLRLRYNIRAEDGYKLVACDLANIEMYLFAAYAGEGRLLTAVRSGEDLHELTAKMLGLRDRKRADGNIETARQLGKTYNFCVPTRTAEILTGRGWLAHADVRIGDVTIGFNPQTEKNEWTKIIALNHFKDAQLVDLVSGKWKVSCTPNHSWLSEKRRDGGKCGRYFERQIVTAEDITSEHYITTSAVAETDGNNDCVQAALVAWIAGDGSRNSTGTWIFQKKPKQRKTIERLLTEAGIDYTTSMQSNGVCRYRIPNAQARTFNVETNNAHLDLHAYVLGLSSAARQAFLEAFIDAEGCTDKGTICVAQNEGPVLEAIRTAAYLCGYEPREYGSNKCKTIRLTKPRITGQKLTKTLGNIEDVWCPTTELGSWTMRQGSVVTLTGNSRIYGGGLRTIKRQFRCSMDEARLLKRRFDDAYPEVKNLTNRIEYRLHDQGFISDKLISGRRFRVDVKDAYKGTNYLVQGTAAALLKASLNALHEDGVPVVALIHDEVVAHVPEDEAEDVKELIIKRLTDHSSLNEVIPLRAEGGVYDHWSDAKPAKDGTLFVPEWAA